MRKYSYVAIAVCVGVTLALPSLVQAQLIPDVDLKTSYRSFAGGPEGGYGSAVLTLKPLGNTWYYIAGASGPNGTTTVGAQTVFFGGKELEIGFRTRETISGVKYGLGVAFPTTFTQSSPSLTYTIGKDFTFGPNTIGAYILGYSGTSLVAIKVSDGFDISNKLSAHISAAVPLNGFSTVSLNNTNSIRMFVGEAELDYKLSSMANLRLGITNALGETTRLSLSTPVGNHYGVLVGFGVKF